MSIDLCYNRNCNKKYCNKLHALSCSNKLCSKLICNHAHINHNPTFCKYGIKCKNNNCYNAHHPYDSGIIMIKYNKNIKNSKDSKNKNELIHVNKKKYEKQSNNIIKNQYIEHQTINYINYINNN